MNAKKYLTVFDEDPAELDKKVNEKLSVGYQLYGNPYTGERLNKKDLLRCMNHQAMVLCNGKK